MRERERIDPDEARRFRTGRDCLDFAHTGGDGEFAVWELLHDDADLARWLAHVARCDEPAVSRGDLARARELRAAISTSARRRAVGEPLTRRDVRAINAAAAEAPLVPELGADGTSDWAVAPTARQALSTLARDAVDLLSGPLAGRIRVCAAADCELLFVDASRPGRRRWCSMERCGNLAKKRAVRARASKEGSR
jgi:predicted RNA-binding Zn ribbon-like protein